MLSLTHTLSASTFYEFRMAAMSRSSEQYLYEDPTKTPHWLVRVASDSALGIEEMVLDPAGSKCVGNPNLEITVSQRQLSRVFEPDAILLCSNPLGKFLTDGLDLRM